MHAFCFKQPPPELTMFNNILQGVSCQLIKKTPFTLFESTIAACSNLLFICLCYSNQDLLNFLVCRYQVQEDTYNDAADNC